MLEYTDLVNTLGTKAFIYRWVGYKIRYFGCWIGVIGSDILRKGRTEITRKIEWKDLLPGDTDWEE